MNFRDRFIKHDLAFIKRQKEHLTSWEIVFVAGIEEKFENNKLLTAHEFNKLQEIAERLKKRRN